MKRIAYFSTQFTTVKSGPGRFAEYLRTSHSDQLSFVFITDDIIPATPEKNIIVSKKYKTLSRIPFYWIVRAYLFNRAFSNWLKKGNTVDAIMCSSALEATFLLRYRHKIPVYVMVNDYKYLKSRSRFWEMFKSNTLVRTLSRVIGFYAEQYSVKKASLVVANSYYTQRAIIDTYQIDPERVAVLYKAVDVSYFEYRERTTFPCASFLFAKNDWRIGGLDLIVEAFSRLSWQQDITLTVVGPPDHERQIIEDLIAEKNFTGKLIIHPLAKREQLLKLFYENDIYISMSRQEALGVSLLEAMATGIPVIASNEGGIPEVLDQGRCGVMVERDNVEELVKQLERIRENPSVLSDNVSKARIQAAAFSKERMEQNLENLYAL